VRLKNNFHILVRKRSDVGYHSQTTNLKEGEKMKKLLNFSIVMVMLLGLLPARAAIAEVMPLWEQLPGGDTGVSSQYNNWFVADDFVFSEAETIGVVEFWTSYLSPTNIHVEFYVNTTDGSGNNIPGGDSIYSEIFSDSIGTVEDSAVCSLSHCAYRHTLRLSTPVALAAGQYWVSIFGEDLLNWSLDSSTFDGSYKAAYWWNDTWNLYQSNLAFRLLEPQETCPMSVEVANTNDSGTGSLRQAIADVCEGGTITFDTSLSGDTIYLTTGQLTLEKSVTIDASTLTNRVTVNADNMSRVLQVNSGVTATLHSLKISHGSISGNGGGIYNQGNLTVNNAVFLNNLSTQLGGGIYNAGGTRLITNSSLIINYATSQGGAIYNANAGNVEVNYSTFSGNEGSSGGGMATESGTTTTINNSTLTGNHATDTYGSGGGLRNRGTMTVVNSTLVENTAPQWGGGICNDGTLTLYNSTLSGNAGHTGGYEGHGLANLSGGILHYANTIIANPPNKGACSNDGTISTNINNLVEEEGGDYGCGASLNVDPMLGLLADNGGPTWTMALQEGSPAIDAGDNDICSGELVGGVDQRGVSRPQPQGGTCDIGAYEYEGEIPSPNQPPVAYNYYAAFYQWLPTEPPGYTFFVPVMDPEGDDLTISYVSDTDPGTEGVVNGVEVRCYEDGCLAQFEFVGPTDVPQEPGSMYIIFQYRVNDGTSDSNTATVTLSFGEWPPYAEYDGKQLAAKDGNTRVRLIGEGYTSLNPEDYAFFIAKQSEHGSLGAPTVVACEIKSDEFYGEVYEWLVCIGEVLYTPEAGFGGEDSFDFVIFDGDSYSEQVTTRLWVADNGPPIAMDATDRVSANQPSQIILEATDPDWKMDLGDFYDMHDIMTFVIGAQPQHGSIGKPSEPICVAENEGANVYARCSSTVLYTPLGDVATEDSFTFYVNDSHADSNTATVTLNLVEPSTLTVNATDDGGDGSCDETQCTLRDAVLDAVPGDTIEFDLVLPNTITLNGKIVINKELTIIGPGADQLTIDGNEVEQWDDGGVFKLEAIWSEDLGSYQPIYVKISGLTIIGGRARAGGGIYNGSNCNLELSDCVIGPNNIVFDAGGGLANVGGTLYLNRCTVMDNHGTGSIGGAGIFTYNGADTTLVNSTVTGNVTNNHGGGILVWYDSAIHLVHSTVTGNTANADYVDYSWGGGGGIYVVVGDDSDPGGKVYIQNSIVAGNIDVTEPDEAKLPDVYGNFTSWGGNLIGDITGTSIESWLASDQVGTAAAPINPLLAELVLNSPGTTPTHALLTGSPAINAVECAYGVTVDQRGVPRPQGELCDIGAYELEQTAATGELKINKVFDPLTSGFTSTFAINYVCDDGVHSGTVNLAASGTTTITGIPTGTQCTITEPTLPTAPTGWTFGTATFSPDTGVVTISEVSPAYAEVTVTNTISRDLGELTIYKDFDPLTSGFTGTFAIVYDCDDGTTHDGTVNLFAGGSETIYDIPTGTICTVTEPTLPEAPVGWTFGEPSFDPENGRVEITGSGSTIVGISMVPVGAEVTVYNTISRDLGELNISKVFNPGDSGFTGTFTIAYDCDGTTHDGTVNLTAGTSQTITGIPTGTQCTVTEPSLPTPPAGWSFGIPTYNPADGTVTISKTIAEVTVTNTISQDAPQLGALRITKAFDPLTSEYKGNFRIHYNCGTEIYGFVDLEAGESLTHLNIPIGTVCTVTEPVLPEAPEGWSFGTPTFSPSGTVTIDAPIVEVTVTNSISKVSQLVSARTKCSLFASGDAMDLPSLMYTPSYNKKTGDEVIKSVTPSTFLYYVKATLPADASTLVIAQGNDSFFPAMGASVTLYDENCVRLSPQLATVSITEGNITINVVEGTGERVIIAAVKYTAKPVIGQIVNGYPDILFTFSAALNSTEPFTRNELVLRYIP
jgi:hypothetical protein